MKRYPKSVIFVRKNEMKIKIIKREKYLRIEKILKKEFIIRTLIFFLIVLYFFITSFIKYGILTFDFGLMLDDNEAKEILKEIKELLNINKLT